MKDLSLKGKKVFLTNVEDRVKFLNCNFLSKNEEKNVYMNLLIFYKILNKKLAIYLVITIIK